MNKKILLIGLLLALLIAPLVISVAPAIAPSIVPANLIFATSGDVGTTGKGGGDEFPIATLPG